MRRARDLAGRRLPCENCGSEKEPVLRRPRYLSPAWRHDPSAYLACGECGFELQVVTGAAALRESDIASDRVPDPLGALLRMDLPARIERLAWSSGEMPGESQLTELMRQGVGDASRAISSRVNERSIVFSHLGAPWIEVALLVGPMDAGSNLGEASGMFGTSVPPLEAAFVFNIDTAESWHGSGTGETARLPAGLELVDVTEFRGGGMACQSRLFRLAAESGG